MSYLLISSAHAEFHSEVQSPEEMAGLSEELCKAICKKWPFQVFGVWRPNLSFGTVNIEAVL